MMVAEIVIICALILYAPKGGVSMILYAHIRIVRNFFKKDWHHALYWVLMILAVFVGVNS